MVQRQDDEEEDIRCAHTAAARTQRHSGPPPPPCAHAGRRGAARAAALVGILMVAAAGRARGAGHNAPPRLCRAASPAATDTKWLLLKGLPSHMRCAPVQHAHAQIHTRKQRNRVRYFFSHFCFVRWKPRSTTNTSRERRLRRHMRELPFASVAQSRRPDEAGRGISPRGKGGERRALSDTSVSALRSTDPRAARNIHTHTLTCTHAELRAAVRPVRHPS